MDCFKQDSLEEHWMHLNGVKTQQNSRGRRRGTWAQNNSAHTDCSLDDDSRANVMLLLDGFNHIGPDDFSRARDFLKTLVPMLGPFGPDLVRVSLVKSGRDPEVEFYLNQFHDVSSMVDAVSVMSQSPPLPGGSTRNAVDFTKREIMRTDRGYRKNTPDALILVTDRNSSGVVDLKNNLLVQDVKVFVVGVKVTDELQGYPNIFTVEDYSSISNILKELTQSFCRWLKEELGRPPPESLRFTDVQPRRARASWDCDPRVQGFNLFVVLDQSMDVQLIYVLGHKRSVEIFHLLPNTSYSIHVRARYSTGFSNEETKVLTTAPQDGVRLSEGLSRCSGFVEVLMDRSWSRVCGKDFGRTEASVVCEELDCGPVSEIQGALFTEGPAVGRSFHCDGAETSLKECESSETLCSEAAQLSCSDAVLKFDGFRCGGVLLELRYKDEWRPVTTSVDPDLDFGSALCEQMGCGSAVYVSRGFWSRSFWWLQPECVKQRSVLTDCIDLDPHMNETEGGLELTCSEFAPPVWIIVSSESVSEGTSVSEVSQSRVQRVLLLLGANFSVSCSLDEPFVPGGQFHLLSPTGNYTLPAVNHSAHFLFQAFSPAHIGNYTCVYCDTLGFVKECFISSTLYVTPGAPDLLIRATIYILSFTLWAIALFFCCKGCGRQRKSIRRTPSSENNMVQMETVQKPSQFKSWTEPNSHEG